jgi:hypothetical protein
MNAGEDIGQFMTTPKSNIKWIPPLSLLLWSCGGIFLDKKGGKAAGMSITTSLQKMIDTGKQVTIFSIYFILLVDCKT